MQYSAVNAFWYNTENAWEKNKKNKAHRDKVVFLKKQN